MSCIQQEMDIMFAKFVHKVEDFEMPLTRGHVPVLINFRKHRRKKIHFSFGGIHLVNAETALTCRFPEELKAYHCWPVHFCGDPVNKTNRSLWIAHCFTQRKSKAQRQCK